jgi:hypothetical protein
MAPTLVTTQRMRERHIWKSTARNSLPALGRRRRLPLRVENKSLNSFETGPGDPGFSLLANDSFRMASLTSPATSCAARLRQEGRSRHDPLAVVRIRITDFGRLACVWCVY